MDMNVGLLGGTGVEARGIALRFAANNAKVIIGSRSAERAQAAADQYNAVLGRPAVCGTSNAEMLALSAVVFLTVPPEQAVSAVTAYRDQWPRGLVLVDVTVPLMFRGGYPEYAREGSVSNSEAIAAALPEGAALAGAFKTIPAHVLADLDEELNCDEFVCGDSPEAKDKVLAVLGMIPTLRALDAGPLRSARILEQMTALAIGLNRRYRKKGARYRVVGV